MDSEGDAVCPALSTFPIVFIWKNVIKIEYQQVDKFELENYLWRNYLHSIKTVFQETNIKIFFAKNAFYDKISLENSFNKNETFFLLLSFSVFNMAISIHFLI